MTMPSLGTQVFGPWQVSLWAWVNWLTLKCLGQHRYGAGDHRFFVNKLTSIDNVLPSGLTLCYRRNVYRQLRAGTLEGDSRTPTGVLQSFSQGGGPGDQLDDVRTLAACVRGVLESYHGESGK